MSQEKCLTEKSYYTNSIRAAVYSKLCKNYAGFKQNRSRGDQIATQSEKFKSPTQSSSLLILRKHFTPWKEKHCETEAISYSK